jgi:NodT family efflux transporter outer membrane factor (OMF) lipoprotein
MPKNHPFFLVLVQCAVLLAGCSTSAIAPQTEELSVPADWARGGDTGAVAANWLAGFADPQLEAFVSEAAAGNYSLQQERARLAAAEQAVVVVRAGRYPSLDVSLDASRRADEDATGTSVSSERFNAALSGRWDLDIWRELSKLQQAAELDLAAQRARLLAVERTVAGTTAGQYFDVMAAAQLLEVAERRLENVTESHDIVASGYRQGLNDALDLYLARNQVERERANYAAQQQSLIEAIADLQLSLARYPDGDLPIAGELPVLEQPIPAGLPSELLTRRADVQEAWLNLLAADAELAAAHKARFPSLSLSGSNSVTSSEFSELMDGGASAWSLALGLAQPLFDAGRLRALEDQAAARVRIAEQQYLDLVFQAFADVENSISRAASLEQRYSALLEAEKNSRAALELALEQYQRGLVPYTTVLESQQQAFDAEATVVQLTNQRLQNRIGLYLALGGEFATMN